MTANWPNATVLPTAFFQELWRQVYTKSTYQMYVDERRTGTVTEAG